MILELDYVLLSLSILFGLLVTVYMILSKGKYVSNAQNKILSRPNKTTQRIPNWDKLPTNIELGDLALLSQYGSLPKYLLHIHDHGRLPITVFWWGTQRVVSVCSPDLFKDTMKLTDRPKMLFEVLEPLISPNSIQYANGLDWEERRKYLYPVLRDDFLKEYIPCFIQIANETAVVWSQLSPDCEIELQEEFFMMTIKGITRTCFGNTFNNDRDLKNMANNYHTVWDEMEKRLNQGPPEPGSERDKAFNESLQSMREAVMSVVKARQDGTDTIEIPFIDALLQSGVSHSRIFGDSITFMVGGLHTTGYLLVWSIYYMTLHPKVMNELVREMKEQVGTNRNEKLIQYVYSTTTYLRKVLDECLRLSNVAPYSARYSDRDITVGGYCIPAGTPIMNALCVSLNNECIWKNVDRFDPEHFGSCSLQSKDSLAFSPFGMGRRKCPGYNFSYIEVGIYLTILLQQFTFKPAGGVVKPVGMFVTSPSEPLHYTVHSSF